MANGGGSQEPIVAIPPHPPALRPLRQRPSRFSGQRRASDASVAGAHVGNCLAGLTREDFPEGMVICTKHGMPAPTGFDEIWLNINGNSAPECELLSQASWVLMFADILDDQSLQDACDLGKSIKLLDETRDAPRVLLASGVTVESQFASLVGCFGRGIDDAIIENTSGLKFAWAVRNRIANESSRGRKWDQEIDRAEARFKQQERLEEARHDTLWCYFKERLGLNVPTIDMQIDRNLPKLFDVRMGKCLGKGSFGRVHKLESLRNRGPTREVVKMVNKSSFPNLWQLRYLSRHIGIMKKLSLDKWKHPNITKLYEVYHSESHILLRMEDGGPVNLHSRLCSRDQQHLPLQPSKVNLMLFQMTDAINHLHTVVNVCHRDLKPENIVVSESIDKIVVKITDFDTSTIQPQLPCKGIIGTFPFASPEVMLTKIYDPYALDVWSLGMNFLEIFCGVHSLEYELEIRVPKDCVPAQKMEMHKRFTTTISHFCRQPEVLSGFLTSRAFSDLRDLKDVVYPLLLGCLKVESAERWSATQCLNYVRKCGGEY